jgi:hypothetical protein
MICNHCGQEYGHPHKSCFYDGIVSERHDLEAAHPKTAAEVLPALRESILADEAKEKTGHLPTAAAARKLVPLASGCLDYFPDALLAVAGVSRVGGEQHHPGEPLRWDRSKSGDEADALARHFMDRGTRDTDGLRHSAKVAWRALALLQKEIEGEQS